MSSGITPPFDGLFLSPGYIAYALLTRSPLTEISVTQNNSPFDLHALATPPAFVLSQDQTLQFYSLAERLGFFECARLIATRRNPLPMLTMNCPSVPLHTDPQDGALHAC